MTNFVYIKEVDSMKLNHYLLQSDIIARSMPGGVKVTIGSHDQNTVVIDSLEQYFKEAD
ncbi:hypothetical protein [Macrococcus hajekii]|uniref:hypothetical protein n=1 Tax=Macrococcus hajekii TaxID=198482 RepID=UPI001669CC40|nr:hypothetical protein [Macrococcus hajekii]